MDFSSGDVFTAFMLTMIAGLSTGIGSIIAFVAKKTNKAFLAVSLGLSAGVMLYVSFVELMNGAILGLSVLYGTKLGMLYAVLSFFSGILAIGIIDKLVPNLENPHEIRSVEDIGNNTELEQQAKQSKLLRVGLFTAMVLAIHNFPEGMVTFLSALKDTTIAIPIAAAIAIHNIPEGISVSIPIYYATGNKKKAFWLSFLSGLAEPLGALIGYFILAPFINETILFCTFAGIAGVMVFISLDELLPAAETHGQHHHAIYGLIAGMAIMAVSLIMF